MTKPVYRKDGVLTEYPLALPDPATATEGEALIVGAGGLVFDTPQESLFNSNGQIPRSQKIKQFFAVVQSDGNGDFTVNWSAAGFSQAPFCVQATALIAPTGTAVDRAWATMRSDITPTTGRGYTLRGATVAAVLVGGGPGTRAAPNTIVHITAYGI